MVYMDMNKNTPVLIYELYEPEVQELAASCVEAKGAKQRAMQSSELEFRRRAWVVERVICNKCIRSRCVRVSEDRVQRGLVRWRVSVKGGKKQLSLHTIVHTATAVELCKIPRAVAQHIQASSYNSWKELQEREPGVTGM